MTRAFSVGERHGGLVNPSWKDQGDSTKSLRHSVSLLLAREQLAAQARLDLLRAVDVLYRSAVVDAPTAAAKKAVCELGCQLYQLIGNSP